MTIVPDGFQTVISFSSVTEVEVSQVIDKTYRCQSANKGRSLTSSSSSSTGWCCHSTHISRPSYPSLGCPTIKVVEKVLELLCYYQM